MTLRLCHSQIPFSVPRDRALLPSGNGLNHLCSCWDWAAREALSASCQAQAPALTSKSFQELLGPPFPASQELPEVPEALKDTTCQQRSDKMGVRPGASLG